MNRTRATKTLIFSASVFYWLLLGTSQATGQTQAAPTSRAKDRAQIVISQALPALDGDHLKTVLAEVRYAPGEVSPPHKHPCPVLVYVVEGSIRTQVEGHPETIYKAGQSFYEPPNGIHQLSANASTTEPARFLAYFICDRDAPLSTDVPRHGNSEGDAQ